MALLYVIFVVAVVLTAGLGVLSYSRGRLPAGGPRAWGEASARRFGRWPGTIIVGVAGYLITLGVSFGLGFLAKSLQSSIDEPIYNYVFYRVDDNIFTRAQNKLTMMGSNPITQVVCMIAIVALVFAYKRRWYIPLLGIAAAYLGEHYMQNFLAGRVDRGHPGLAYPPAGSTGNVLTLGTFPSGGVGRILAVYGAIVVLTFMLQPGLTRRWRTGVWTGLVLMAVVEAFSRIYLSKHWATDAIFAVPFGAMLLASNIAGLSALSWTAGPHSSGDLSRSGVRAARGTKDSRTAAETNGGAEQALTV